MTVWRVMDRSTKRHESQGVRSTPGSRWMLAHHAVSRLGPVPLRPTASQASSRTLVGGLRGRSQARRPDHQSRLRDHPHDDGGHRRRGPGAVEPHQSEESTEPPPRRSTRTPSGGHSSISRRDRGRGPDRGPTSCHPSRRMMSALKSAPARSQTPRGPPPSVEPLQPIHARRSSRLAIRNRVRLSRLRGEGGGGARAHTLHTGPPGAEPRSSPCGEESRV